MSCDAVVDSERPLDSRVSDHLAWALSLRDQQVEEYLRLHPDLPADYRLLQSQADSVADVLFKHMTTMGHMDTIDDTYEVLRSSPGDPDDEERIRIRLQMEGLGLHFAKDAVSAVKCAEKRWQRLMQMIRLYERSDRTSGFLRRISRLYLYGWDYECAVFCRSAMETELKAEIPNDDLPKPPHRRQPDLRERIEIAYRQERLSKESKQQAHKLRKGVNDILHEFRVTLTAEECVTAACAVLANLHETRPPATPL